MSNIPDKSVTKVYSSTLLALRGGGWMSNIQEKKHYVTLEWPHIWMCSVFRCTGCYGESNEARPHRRQRPAARVRTHPERGGSGLSKGYGLGRQLRMGQPKQYDLPVSAGRSRSHPINLADCHLCKQKFHPMTHTNYMLDYCRILRFNRLYLYQFSS